VNCDCNCLRRSIGSGRLPAAGHRRGPPDRRGRALVGRNVLGEDEAKAVLAACGIEVAQGKLATGPAQARELAEQMGFRSC